MTEERLLGILLWDCCDCASIFSFDSLWRRKTWRALPLLEICKGT
jgi:hypothetical protein